MSSESPVLNPRLPWPRVDPCLFPITPPLLDAEALPPTQRFEVHLRDCRQQVVLSDSPLEDCPKREWTQGGLNGGRKLDFCSLPTTLRNLDGWWIGIQGVRWQQIPIESVAGRTVRQEREMLGLMGVDTTSTAMIGFSDEGPFKVPWNYKFPRSARDLLVIVVIRADQNERDAWEWVINLPRVTALPPPPRATSSCRVTQSDTRDAAESKLTSVTQEPASGQRPRGRRDTQKSPSKAPAPDCSAPPSLAVGSTVLVELSGKWRCVKRDGVKTVAQLLEDEWGMPREKCIVTVDGRQISLDATLASFFIGVP